MNRRGFSNGLKEFLWNLMALAGTLLDLGPLAKRSELLYRAWFPRLLGDIFADGKRF